LRAMTVSPRPMQPSRDERRTHLSRAFIDVVERLLDDGRPFGDVSVGELIEAAGVSRATFYRYYDDKGDLLQALGDCVVGEVETGGRAWWELAPEATMADLRAALLPAVKAYRQHRVILGAVIETAGSDPRVRDQHTRLINGTIDALARHIEGEQAAGRVAPSLDPARTATWLVWMLERGLYQVVAPASRAEADRMVDAVAEVIWRTLYAGYRGE